MSVVCLFFLLLNLISIFFNVIGMLYDLEIREACGLMILLL